MQWNKWWHLWMKCHWNGGFWLRQYSQYVVDYFNISAAATRLDWLVLPYMDDFTVHPLFSTPHTIEAIIRISHRSAVRHYHTVHECKGHVTFRFLDCDGATDRKETGFVIYMLFVILFFCMHYYGNSCRLGSIITWRHIDHLVFWPDLERLAGKKQDFFTYRFFVVTILQGWLGFGFKKHVTSCWSREVSAWLWATCRKENGLFLMLVICHTPFLQYYGNSGRSASKFMWRRGIDMTSCWPRAVLFWLRTTARKQMGFCFVSMSVICLRFVLLYIKGMFFNLRLH